MKRQARTATAPGRKGSDSTNPPGSGRKIRAKARHISITILTGVFLLGLAVSLPMIGDAGENGSRDSTSLKLPFWSARLHSVEQAQAHADGWLENNREIRDYLSSHGVAVRVMSGSDAGQNRPFSTGLMESKEPKQIVIPFVNEWKRPSMIEYAIKFELGHWVYKFEIRPGLPPELTVWEQVLFSHRVCSCTADEGLGVIKKIDRKSFKRDLTSKCLTSYDLSVIYSGMAGFLSLPFPNAMKQLGYRPCF